MLKQDDGLLQTIFPESCDYFQHFLFLIDLALDIGLMQIWCLMEITVHSKTIPVVVVLTAADTKSKIRRYFQHQTLLSSGFCRRTHGAYEWGGLCTVFDHEADLERQKLINNFLAWESKDSRHALFKAVKCSVQLSWYMWYISCAPKTFSAIWDSIISWS